MTREEAINLYWNIRYDVLNSKKKEALDVAFEALREQEERSKGCEYCHPPFRTLLTVTIDPETGEEPLNIFFECDGQSLRAYDDNPSNPQIDKLKIRACPMCGRKLEVEG